MSNANPTAATARSVGSAAAKSTFAPMPTRGLPALRPSIRYVIVNATATGNAFPGREMRVGEQIRVPVTAPMARAFFRQRVAVTVYVWGLAKTAPAIPTASTAVRAAFAMRAVSRATMRRRTRIAAARARIPVATNAARFTPVTIRVRLLPAGMDGVKVNATAREDAIRWETRVARKWGASA